MRIAITADVHLTSQEKHPERFHALVNILDQLVALDINTLVIAGDLFDASCKDPGELEGVVRESRYDRIQVVIIPGNHDPVLSQGAFTLANIRYITQPQLMAMSGDASILFVPYAPRTTIGETIASCTHQLDPGEWVLVGHGDYLAGTGLRNNYEGGSYMPLSGRDLQTYQPQKAFLGHIHAPYDSSKVHYPGSPCGLDISETGIRSFLIYDSQRGMVERKQVDTDIIYLQASLLVLPMLDEVDYVRKILVDRLSRWNLTEGQKRKVRMRVNLEGYTTDRERLLEVTNEILAENEFALADQPDLSRVKLSNDVTRADITAEVQNRFQGLGIPIHQDEPTIDEYILSAMSQIYGE